MRSPPEWFGLVVRSAVPLWQRTAPPDAAVLLCDVARRERAGVQLLYIVAFLCLTVAVWCSDEHPFGWMRSEYDNQLSQGQQEELL